MRKIIQFEMVEETRKYNWFMIALCDDGTLWRIGDDMMWYEISPIPQPELNKDKQIPQNPQPDPTEYA